jgi:hypothetical protein
MVLQNKSDSSNWTCTKIVTFPFEFTILKMFIAETYPFSRKLPGKRKFLRKRKFSRNEISRKFAHFRIIFAFRENGKTRFRFNPSMIPLFLSTLIHERKLYATKARFLQSANKQNIFIKCIYIAENELAIRNICFIICQRENLKIIFPYAK